MSPVVVGRGPRRVEDTLLAAVEQTLGEAGVVPARRVRVIVPSRSLLEHVSAALVRRGGRARLGVRVQTLAALAHEVLDADGADLAEAGRAFRWLVREAGREVPSLAQRFELLEDGWTGVAAAVSDLLDAGLDEDVLPALEEAFAADAHALALTQVAAGVARRMRDADIGRDGDRFARAAERLARDLGPLADETVFVHGFAETTGRAGDLISALVRHAGARVFVDLPPDPRDPGREAAAAAFAGPLLERLGGSAPSTDTPAAPRLSLIEASGRDAEVRSVADRIRARIADGIEPERIAIVARDLEPYLFALRRQLGRAGVPFSGCGQPGPRTAGVRGVRALAMLMRERERAPIDAFLDLCAGLGPDGDHASVHLRYAVHREGLARVGDLAARESAPAARRARPLRGLRADDRRTARAYREVEERDLASLAQLADSVCSGLPDGIRPLDLHLDDLRTGLRDRMRVDPASPAAVLLARVLDSIAEGIPGALALEASALAALIDEGVDEVGRGPLGGAGAGVQVLTVTEARGRTFDALFLLGLNRDVFPRAIRPDALLSDELRRAARAVLPDLPVKQAGHEEERYLFAQLLASSPEVALSWLALDDDDRALTAATPIEELRLAFPELEPEPAVGPLGAGSGRTALEHAIRGGLAAGRRGFAPRVGLVLAEADPALDPDTVRALAGARDRVLEERDRDDVSRAGPYLGLIGRRPEAPDPRAVAPTVTAAERLAECPWQTLLSRVLGLAGAVDALAELDGMTPLALGNTVHGALERIATRAGVPRAGGLDAALTHAPVDVAWPEPKELDAMLLEAAGDALANEGLGLPGLGRALVERARPYMDEARAALFRGDRAVFRAVEVEGAAPLGDETRRLEFRADAVLDLEGHPELVDYKTGGSVQPIAKGLPSGRLLQAAAYARGAAGADGSGAYLWLAPRISPRQRHDAVGADDEAHLLEFDRVASLLLEAWDEGVFFPRLAAAAGDEPSACRYCDLPAACLRGEPSAERRVARWLATEATDPDEPSTLRGVWALGEGAR